MMLTGLFDSSRYAMTAYAWPPLGVGFITLGLGALVILRERGSRVSWAFGLMTLMVAVWLAAIGVAYAARDAATAMRWIRIEHLGVVCIPTGVLLFMAAVVRRVQACRWLLVLSGLLSAMFYAAVLRSSGFISGLFRYPWGFYAHYGPLSLPFLLFFFAVLVFSLRLLWDEHRVCKLETPRRRLKALLVAFSVGYLGSIDYFATYGVPLYPCGYLPVFAFVMLSAWAIWRYHLVDITPAFAAPQIMETMADGLLVLDRDGVIRVANSAACALFGRVKSADLIGRPIRTVWSCFLPADHMDELLASGTLQGHETTLVSRRGQEIVLSVSASVMRDPAGEPAAIVCIARDVTARARMERALHQAHTELEQRVRERTAELAKANAMLKSALEQRKEIEDALRRARNESEQRVIERTAKLQAANDQLQTDITQRQAAEEALARTNAELERFTWLAVGREERIVELKRQINALSRQLGQAEPYDLAFMGQSGHPPEASHRTVQAPAARSNGRVRTPGARR